ncbi:DNA recombination protein RmuC [Candidatus Magnetoovum chiemensis]|nr:DNA recombination protein RmuC [Candidatus Magnetoovum chiemensis]
MIETILVLIITAIILLLFNLYLSFKTQPKNYDNRFIEIKSGLEKVVHDLVRADAINRDEFSRNRDELTKHIKDNRDELNNSFKNFGDTINNSLKSFEQRFTANVKDFNDLQKQKFDSIIISQQQLSVKTETKLENIRDTVEKKLSSIQEDNSKKLEHIRVTVDEKLQSTVEKRFNESFKLISERLEQVHKGLGEMQSLASGVGDLKKILSNVKTRGTLGEIQLGSILEQILSSEQFERNAKVKHESSERVEYAVKLPGNNDKPVLLPIDSKFPIEDYQRLIEAYEAGSSVSSKEAEDIYKQFEGSVKKNAKDIKDKYINPPLTTDFAIMFVPTEGLYAEILRKPGFFETLQRDYRVTVVGPSNLVAFLSSLQMGFRTLTIEKRSSEVWELLGAVKTEFGRFADILEKTKRKLQEASNVIDTASVRTRAIERKLRDVQELPGKEAEKKLLPEDSF